MNKMSKINPNDWNLYDFDEKYDKKVQKESKKQKQRKVYKSKKRKEK